MIRKYNTETKALGRIREDFEGLFLGANEIKLQVVINDYPSATDTQKVTQIETIDTEKKEWTISYNVNDLTDLEIALRDWDFIDFNIQIIAPISMVLTDFGVKMKGWFELLGLPILPKGDIILLYCNKIDDQFKETVDQLVLDGVITIKEKPQ